MWSPAIEVFHILLEDTPQVHFAHNQHVVQAFTPNTPQQSFADGIRSWRLDRCSQHLDPATQGDSPEVRTIFRIVITNQILWRELERRRLTELLRYPFIGWRSRHIDMDNPPGAKFSHEEREDRLEEEVMKLEEVTSPGVCGMVPEEGRPGLTIWTRRSCLSHVPLDRPFRDVNIKLQQFSTNSVGAPQSVVNGHLLNQRNRLRCDLRLA